MGFFDSFFGGKPTPKQSEASSKEYIYHTLQQYDEIRNHLMYEYFQGGDKSIMMMVQMLHEFACPLFYAWEYFGYGQIQDFWKEDLAVDVFEKFKSSDVLDETRRSYNTLSFVFPFRALDTDGSLKEHTENILKELINCLERDKGR